MKIHQLERSKGLKDKQRRKGRWNATWTGNYSGKGLKGQKSRSGFSMKPFFEGGQTSIVQRLPKAKWFKRYYKLVKDFTIVNLWVLDADSRIVDSTSITKEILKELWYIKKVSDAVKILWHGDYAKKLSFVGMDAISASAQSKIDNPGTVHSLPRKAPVKSTTVKKTKSSPKAPLISNDVTTEKNTIKKPAAKKTTTEKKVAAKKPVAKKTTTEKKVAVKKTK